MKVYKNRVRVYCFWPTEVFRCKYYRAGFYWFSWAWFDMEDECYYIGPEDLPWPIDEQVEHA